jgi:two-component system chemotaxis response regulator CheB
MATMVHCCGCGDTCPGELPNVMGELEVRLRISVLIVDDSAFMRAALSRMIASDPDLHVVGTAGSGTEGLERILALDPDVVTLDVQMPGLDGLETLRRIMAESPRPVLMVSSSPLKDNGITFDALAAGAFDYVPKQLSSASLDIAHIYDDLIGKIKAAAQSRHSRTVSLGGRKLPNAAVSLERETTFTSRAIVAIGTSTGGPKALQEILPLLPADLPVPVLIVQHMPLGFTAPFAQRLNGLCSVKVREAFHHEVLQRGVVYIAPAGTHMTVELANSRTVICLTPEPEHRRCIHEVDAMMNSVASMFQNRAMGIIMTGMGTDGALGMKAIRRGGGLTIGQDEASCSVYGMPRACADLGILDRVVPLSQIPQQMLRATRYRQPALAHP